MTSQSGQYLITKYTLPNIRRSKGNQEMTFGRLMKYSVTDIYIQKLRKFLKKSVCEIQERVVRTYF